MSRFATRIKSIFSFNSDSYHVHKATEEELLSSQAGPPPPVVVLRRAPKPPEPQFAVPGGVSLVSGVVDGGGGGVGSTTNNITGNKSIALKPAPDKKLSKQRKVSLVGSRIYGFIVVPKGLFCFLTKCSK